MPRHPDSERHVSSYTTLVPSHRITENSCSECVSGLLAAFHLYGRPLVVSRLFAARDDVGEILRGACALDGHEDTVDVGEGALERGKVGDGRRAHRRDGLALGLDGIQVVLPVGSAWCCASSLFYRLEKARARWFLWPRWLVGTNNHCQYLRGIYRNVPVSSVFLLERMKQWPRAPHTREGKSDGPV